MEHTYGDTLICRVCHRVYWEMVPPFDCGHNELSACPRSFAVCFFFERAWFVDDKGIPHYDICNSSNFYTGYHASNAAGRVIGRIR